jgi:ribonuclease HI
MNLSKKKLSIFVDGASRNNPGPAGVGIYITHGENLICKSGYFIGEKTNNQAEYLALLVALLIAEKKLAEELRSPPPIFIVSDSELLVRQMEGSYRVKNKEIAKIKSIIDSFLKNKSYQIKHVLRSENKIADKLANEGINKKTNLPVFIIEFLKEHEIGL